MAVNPIRTLEELKDPEFNYFIAFKVGLNETDKAKIEPKIKTILSDPKGSVHSRRLLELKNDIMEIMCNDAVYDANTGTYKANAGGRAKEAAAAKTIKLRSTVEMVEILCQTRKTLLQSDIDDLYNSANKPVSYFTADELKSELQYLQKMGIKIIDNVDTRIPFGDYQKIEQLLKALEKGNLYEFLGVDVKASEADITAKTDEIYKNSQKTNDLKKKQAMGDLCSRVKKIILSSKEARKSYDQYLILKEDVWSDFEKRKSFGVKEMSMADYENYVQTAMTLLKIGVDDAEKILAIGCKFFQITIIGGGQSNFSVCPYSDCGKLYTNGAKSCPHCGKPLEVFCWNCEQKTPFTKDDRGCASCGATNHAHEMYKRKCVEIDRLLGNPTIEIPEIKSALLSLKNIVPTYEKIKTSTLKKKVDEYENEIAKREKIEGELGVKYKADVAKIRELAAKKQYQTAYLQAKNLLAKYNTYQVEATKKLLQDMMSGFALAQQQLNIAKQALAQRNERLIIAHTVKALELCSDYTEARQILQKFPPKPVGAVRAILDDNKVRLEWDDASQQEYITYTVVKKIGIAPTSAEDGSIVEKELSIKFCEDANIVSASPYYYAVYAERYGVKSPVRTAMAPITLYADVKNIQQEMVIGGISVTWETPQNVKNIEVWKNKGSVAPSKIGEGVKVNCTENGFTDAKAEGENAYLIVCTYQLKDGTINSKGKQVVFKPYVKTSPLEGVKIEPLSDGKYVFTANPGYEGKVELYVSDKALSIPTNKTLKYIDFNNICKGLVPLNTTLNTDSGLTFELPAGKIWQVYPMVKTEQLFIVSPPKLFNCIEGFRCTHAVENGTVVVKGTLHPKVTSIVATISNTAFVEKIEDCREKYVFKASDFEADGKIEIKLKTNTLNYITLFPEFNNNGVVSYSTPIKLTPPIDHRETVAVFYCLEYDASPMKPFKVTVSFEAEQEVEIPKLLLMQGHPRPLNKTAGQLTERLESIKLKKGLFSSKYKGKHTVTVSPTANAADTVWTISPPRSCTSDTCATPSVPWSAG